MINKKRIINNKIFIRLLLVILIINLIIIYSYTICFLPNVISIQDQGCTCAQWKTYFGSYKIKQKLIEKGYQLDSIAIDEFNTSGLKVDSLNQYFPYDGFQINFEIDTVVLNINSNKKYCPLLKVNSWSHENKYLELMNYLIFIICLLILIGKGIKNIIFNIVKK